MAIGKTGQDRDSSVKVRMFPEPAILQNGLSYMSHLEVSSKALDINIILNIDKVWKGNLAKTFKDLFTDLSHRPATDNILSIPSLLFAKACSNKNNKAALTWFIDRFPPLAQENDETKHGTTKSTKSNEQKSKRRRINSLKENAEQSTRVPDNDTLVSQESSEEQMSLNKSPSLFQETLFSQGEEQHSSLVSFLPSSTVKSAATSADVTTQEVGTDDDKRQDKSQEDVADEIPLSSSTAASSSLLRKDLRSNTPLSPFLLNEGKDTNNDDDDESESPPIVKKKSFTKKQTPLISSNEGSVKGTPLIEEMHQESPQSSSSSDACSVNTDEDKFAILHASVNKNSSARSVAGGDKNSSTSSVTDDGARCRINTTTEYKKGSAKKLTTLKQTYLAVLEGGRVIAQKERISTGTTDIESEEVHYAGNTEGDKEVEADGGEPLEVGEAKKQMVFTLIKAAHQTDKITKEVESATLQTIDASMDMNSQEYLHQKGGIHQYLGEVGKNIFQLNIILFERFDIHYLLGAESFRAIYPGEITSFSSSTNDESAAGPTKKRRRRKASKKSKADKTTKSSRKTKKSRSSPEPAAEGTKRVFDESAMDVPDDYQSHDSCSDRSSDSEDEATKIEREAKEAAEAAALSDLRKEMDAKKKSIARSLNKISVGTFHRIFLPLVDTGNWIILDKKIKKCSLEDKEMWARFRLHCLDPNSSDGLLCPLEFLYLLRTHPEYFDWLSSNLGPHRLEHRATRTLAPTCESKCRKENC